MLAEISPSASADLRAGVDAALAEGNDGLALHLAETLWTTAATLPNAGFIKIRLKAVAGRMDFPRRRIAILRSCTVETTAPFLEAGALVGRMVLDIKVGQYNGFIQDLMMPPQEPPDATLVVLHTRTAAPALWDGEDEGEMRRDSNWLLNNLSQALVTYRAHTSGAIVLQLLDAPAGERQRDHVTTANAALTALAAGIADCHVLDPNPVIAAHGDQWYDTRNWSVAKIPYRNVYAAEVAEAWLQRLRPALGRPYKVIVTDLDNTLWGGILGEDGAQGLIMEDTGTAGYRQVQMALKALKDRGFLLAIASKNDLEPALRVLAEHPLCLLRPDDFAAMRINWQPKSANIAAMAEELGLGRDAIVFLDDSPIERAEVAGHLPMVRVLPHHTDAAATAAMLSSHADLQRLIVTEEDRQRTGLYRNRQAAIAAANTLSRADFLTSLAQEVIVESLTAEAFLRVAELERKTNQFNLRTRRLSEAEIRAFAAGGAQVLAVRVIDRFGDNGIVGAAVTTFVSDEAMLESFLMSCRVIGRDIENAMLSLVMDAARAHGCKRLTGGFLPTAKNAMAADFYQDHGFTSDGRVEKDGVTWWTHETALGAAPLPAAVRIKKAEVGL
jgi:FkbH-like protein